MTSTSKQQLLSEYEMLRTILVKQIAKAKKAGTDYSALSAELAEVNKLINDLC